MNIGKLLTIAGIVITFIGLSLTYAPWLISWFGRLPGDIRIEGENHFIFIPITSMIIISVVLTLVINLFFRR
jgi:H+/Cl- antiporter ClcA